MAGSGAGSPRRRHARTRNPHPNQNGGRGAPTCQEKAALGTKVAALIRLAESDFPQPRKWPSVSSRASRKVVVPPGVLVRQNAHHHYKEMARQSTPAGARAVLLEHHGMDCPAPTTATQTTATTSKAKRGAATATPATPATPAPTPAGQGACSPKPRSRPTRRPAAARPAATARRRARCSCKHVPTAAPVPSRSGPTARPPTARPTNRLPFAGTYRVLVSAAKRH